MIINITDKYTHHSHDLYSAIETVIDKLYLDETGANVAILVDSIHYTRKDVYQYLDNRYGLSYTSHPHHYHWDIAPVGKTTIYIMDRSHYYRLMGYGLTFAIIPNPTFIQKDDDKIYDLVKCRTMRTKHIIRYI